MNAAALQPAPRTLYIDGVPYEVPHQVWAHMKLIADLNSQFANKIAAQEARIAELEGVA